MESANRCARSVRIGVAAVAVLGVLSGAPGMARAGTPNDNPCVTYMAYQTEQDVEKNRITECTPGTSGMFPIWNENLIDPILSFFNSYFGNNNVGGPVAAARERSISQNGNPFDRAGAQALAAAVQRANGSGMPAGQAVTGGSGDWVERHAQKLRDLHVATWFNTTWSGPRDTHTPTRYDSDIWTITFGADLPLMNDQLIVGVFGSYTNSDVHTGFNNGEVDSDIGTIGPYFAYTVNQFLAVDLTVAGVFGEHDNEVGGPPGSPSVSGDQDTDGFFISMNANANYWVGNIGVQGRLGFLHSDMETDSYTLGGLRIPGSNNELTQLALAVQLNYFYDKGLPFLEETMAMPFFRVTFNHDIDHDNIQLPFGVSQHPNDDDEVVLAWGAQLFGNGPISGSIETGPTLARSDFKSWTVSGTLNYAF